MQSGFRKSCSTCLLYITDFIRKEIDLGKMGALVLLDLQKAFRTVDHNILLSKMKALGLDILNRCICLHLDSNNNNNRDNDGNKSWTFPFIPDNADSCFVNKI